MERLSILLLCGLIGLAGVAVVGCGDDDDEAATPAGDGERNGRPAAVDRSDPQAVAAAFVEAVRAEDSERVLSLASDDFRDELARDIEQGWPDIPDDYEVELDVEGDQAEFTSGPFANRLKVVKTDGQWAVAD